MNVICADSVSYGQEAFAAFGNVTLVPENRIHADRVRGADAVVTRSKTRLDPTLLEGSGVQFAGTCTAGTDHVDIAGLEDLGITFSAAPGCNANAVSEYVLAALLEIQLEQGFRLQDLTLGIVGHGQVGTRVDAKWTALGGRVLRNDPPKAAAGAPGPFVDLETLLRESDVVTLHVPLIEAGPWPTRDLLSEEAVRKLKPGAILINACRGEAMNGSAVLDARQSGALSALILDVWDPEPSIPLDLLAVSDFATPHIAGHSLEGKVNGTSQVREALRQAMQADVPDWDAKAQMPAALNPECVLPETGSLEERLRTAVRACYDLRKDDEMLRQGSGDIGERFTFLRRNYPHRREFDATRLIGVPVEEETLFRALGFGV